MKSDDPLAAALSALRVPPADPAARERALYRATIALRQGSTEPVVATQAPHRRFAMGLSAIGALAIILAFAATAFWRLERPRQPEAITAASIEAARTMLAQIQALFGPQLNAVVERPGTPLDIRLSDGPGGDAGHSQPILIVFTRGGETIRVLGFSGRFVCVDLAGRRTCFEPLATGDGGVILSGENFCWTPRDRGLSGYRVATRLLSNS